jgi:integrase
MLTSQNSPESLACHKTMSHSGDQLSWIFDDESYYQALQAEASRDIVVVETNSGKPSKGDFERLARRRFQSPKPMRVGNWWYITPWVDKFIDGRRIRKKERIKLAPASTNEREVKKMAAERLRPMNQGLQSIGSATLFEDFVMGTYSPIEMPLLAKSTRDRYEGVLKNYVRPAFGALMLRDVGTLVIQRYFAEMAKSPLSHESLDKIRDVLSSVMNSAVRYGLLIKNPVEGVRLPPRKRGNRVKPFIDEETLDRIVTKIREPYATMVYVAAYTGLRPSELIGLKWGDIGEDFITIDERYCRGDWSAPKSTASNASIPVDELVIERIRRFKDVIVEVRAGRAVRRGPAVRSCGPDDLVFRSVAKGVTMRDNNILVRHIKPAARAVGVGWVNWQVLRRSFATWHRLSGTDVKDAQALMRHSRASTTLDIYQQNVRASERAAVNKLAERRKLRLVSKAG